MLKTALNNENNKSIELQNELLTQKRITNDMNKKVNSLGYINNVLPYYLDTVRTVKNNLKNLDKMYKNDVTNIYLDMESKCQELIEMVSTVNDKSKVAMSEYQKEVRLRRKYFNELQELRGNIRVYCRARPIIKKEINAGQTELSIKNLDKYTITLKSHGNKREKKFEFDRIFNMQSTQCMWIYYNI